MMFFQFNPEGKKGARSLSIIDWLHIVFAHLRNLFL